MLLETRDNLALQCLQFGPKPDDFLVGSVSLSNKFLMPLDSSWIHYNLHIAFVLSLAFASLRRSARITGLTHKAVKTRQVA